VAAVGLAAAALGASADLVDIVWDDGTSRFDKALWVPSGDFTEVCGKFEQGDKQLPSLQ